MFHGRVCSARAQLSRLLLLLSRLAISPPSQMAKLFGGDHCARAVGIGSTRFRTVSRCAEGRNAPANRGGADLTIDRNAIESVGAPRIAEDGSPKL